MLVGLLIVQTYGFRIAVDCRWHMGTHRMRCIAPALTRMGVLTAHPAAFAIVLCYVSAWLIFSFDTLDWHAVATIATWIMTLFIQRAEHRDTQAIHAKLDELLKAEGRARTELAKLDGEEPEAIEEHRFEEQRSNS
jgi:low affinity Fe/Cu permease